MADDKGKTNTPTPEEVAKSHATALAAKDTEIATVRKELADAKAEFAVQIAKLAPVVKTEPALPAEFQKRLDDADAKRVDLEKKLQAVTDENEVRASIEKAATFAGLTVERSALAKSLRLIRKALPAADAEVVEQTLMAASNQAKENDAILREIGRAGKDVDANSPEAQLDALVAKHATANGVSKYVAKVEVTKSGEGAVLFQKVLKNEADKAGR